jgi:arginine N-succinyltransferase
MTLVLRPARTDDLPALYQMAKRTGSGLTNFPADRPTLKAKIARAALSFARDDDVPADDLFLFVLENTVTRKVIGTCQIFARIGSSWPFYSYRIDRFSQYSRELDRTIHAETLTLATELGGCTEVGGLFLDPGERALGAGALIARSRYLFIRSHRQRFADRTIAELRGFHDNTGGSPFWDGIAGRFFGMTFREADEFNAIHGNQFIADLMPKHPIYIALLPDSVRAAIGAPHQSGRAAQQMLENEGFVFGNYVDIFDGGPTMSVATDAIATIRSADDHAVVKIGAVEQGEEFLIAHGRLAAFRAYYGRVASAPGGIVIDEATAQALAAEPGSRVACVAR